MVWMRLKIQVVAIELVDLEGVLDDHAPEPAKGAINTLPKSLVVAFDA